MATQKEKCIITPVIHRFYSNLIPMPYLSLLRFCNYLSFLAFYSLVNTLQSSLQPHHSTVTVPVKDTIAVRVAKSNKHICKSQLFKPSLALKVSPPASSF